jgi:hypothetical protein
MGLSPRFGFRENEGQSQGNYRWFAAMERATLTLVGTQPRGWTMIKSGAVLPTAVICFALAAGPACGQAGPGAKTRQVDIAYVAPKDPAHRRIHDLLKEHRALEKLQDFLSPVRLPRKLLLKVEGCDGDSNAWYDSDAVTVCYEYLEEVRQNAPAETTPDGITPWDAVLGPFVDVFLHEIGHALFDLLRIPLFGREEDAADQFSAYIMLQFGKEDARRLIAGAAYVFKNELQTPNVTMEVKAFSDEHGTPAQRFFNILCIAYGADSELFAGVVAKGYLPQERAELCEDEYRQVAYAFETLISPHIDPVLAEQVRAKKWLPDPSAMPPSRARKAGAPKRRS